MQHLQITSYPAVQSVKGDDDRNHVRPDLILIMWTIIEKNNITGMPLMAAARTIALAVLLFLSDVGCLSQPLVSTRTKRKQQAASLPVHHGRKTLQLPASPQLFRSKTATHPLAGFVEAPHKTGSTFLALLLRAIIEPLDLCWYRINAQSYQGVCADHTR